MCASRSALTALRRGLLGLALVAAITLGLPAHADDEPPPKPAPREGAKPAPKPAPPDPKSDGKTKEPKKAKKPKPPKPTPESLRLARIRKALRAIGAEFKEKDAAALVARIESSGKVELTVKGKTGQYRAQQAKKNLEGWFSRMRSITSAELDRVSGLHGSFTVKGRIKGRDAVRKFALTVELREVKATSDGGTPKLYLRKIAVRVLEAKPRANKR